MTRAGFLRAAETASDRASWWRTTTRYRCCEALNAEAYTASSGRSVQISVGLAEQEAERRAVASAESAASRAAAVVRVERMEEPYRAPAAAIKPPPVDRSRAFKFLPFSPK